MCVDIWNSHKYYRFCFIRSLSLFIDWPSYISRSSDFALYLEDYLMYVHHTFGVWISTTLTFDLKINAGHCDLYFMVQWLCLIPWRLFHERTSLFRIMNQYEPMQDLKNKCRSPWPIFYGTMILCYIVKTIWCMNIILGDYGSVWPDIWPLNKCMSLWPIFHSPLIFPYISKTIWWMSVTFLDNETVWHKLISWSLDFAFYHCHRLKLFVYIKKWCRPGVFVPLQALALVY